MKIGKRVKAKKYKPLREKQATANAMLKEAKGRLKEDHRNIKSTKKKIAQFYHSRGLKVPSRLSFKSLSTKDLKAYNNLLDSIINDTFINKEKYTQYRDKMEENFKEQFGDSMPEISMDDFINIMNHPIVKQLLDMGMSPSDFIEFYQEFIHEGLSDRDFLLMLYDFSNELGEDFLIEDFFVYARMWEETYLTYQEIGKDWGFNSWAEYREEYLIYRGL